MILNVLLIASGLLFIIATGFFLFELRRAPSAAQDEKGFRLHEPPGPERTGKLDSRSGAYSHQTPSAPISAL